MKKIRECSGVIPFRVDSNCILQVLMVKTKSNVGWAFPKGGVEPGLTKKENAIKEAFEEAGVIGVITEKLGKYSFTKNNQKQKITMYAMKVVCTTDKYPEAKFRDSAWVDIETAKLSVNHEMLVEFLTFLSTE